MDGVPVRVWEGVSEGGVRCKVFVHRVAVEADQDCEAFEEELREVAEPRELRVIPLRMIL